MPGTPLTNIRQIIERSIFHSIRVELVDKGYIPDVLLLITNSITAVITGVGGSFTFGPGDFTINFLVGRTFTVTGSTGNDATYTVASSSFGGGETTVVIIGIESIPDGTVDGVTNMLNYFNDSVGVALFKTALVSIATGPLGYAIEIFGVGSPTSRQLKKIPRIVIMANRTLPGALGGNPDRFYDGIGPDPLKPDTFDAKILPPQTVDFQYDIHIISKEARQSRVMHELVALGMPKRGYINTFLNPDQKLFVNQYSYRDIPNSTKGIDEQIYLYEVMDIFETKDKTVQTGIKPLLEIKVEPHVGDAVPPGQTPTDTDQVDDFIIN